MSSELVIEETKCLIEDLENAAALKKRGKATKRVLDILDSEKKLVSWKFNEWDYAKNNISLPSNARGLFTLLDEPKIAVRGYDKFFNINEVYSTRWDWLEQNTKGPYNVTAKENGCIILISGLEDGTIIVCSKHSTGARNDTTKNHAVAGQTFLEKQLKELNLSTKDLALKLFELNLTAVAEFCDDYFEEHIIEYKGRDAGLYLHGLNLNKPIFETYSMEKVDDFARQWGFKTVENFTEKSIHDLQSKLEDYSKSGSYNNKEVEGFVIRCKMLNGQDYFFKFKFEEPYLMYRQWREVTKEYIAHGKRSNIKFTKHKYITNQYLDFVIPLLDKNPKLAEDYKAGFGIISLRNNFLKDYGKSGPEILNQERLDELEALNSLKSLKIDETTKFVIVPVATIGCGKTTTAQTLINLFKETWGLVSNDDIPNGKTAKVIFVKKGLEILSDRKVVVLDRNNHQYRERQQIFDDFNSFRDDFFPHNTNVQFICLNFVPETANNNELWSTTVQRVFDRGDNHQSIKAVTEAAKVKGIMSGFIKRFQPVIEEKLPDSKFDLVIDLEPSGKNSSLTNAKKIIDILHKKYPVLFDQIPTESEVETAFSSALSYRPSFHKVIGKDPSRENKKNKQKPEKKEAAPIKESGKEKKARKPVFFSIDIPDKGIVISSIDDLLSEKVSSKNVQAKAWEYLKESNKFQEEFHVTLAHFHQGRRGNEHEKKVWSKYIDAYESATPGSGLNLSADVSLKRLIWNDKIVTVLVEILDIYDNCNKKTLDLGHANRHPHITVGILSNDVKPVYSNTLAEEADFETGEGSFGNNLNIVQWDNEQILKSLPLKVNF